MLNKHLIDKIIIQPKPHYIDLNKYIASIYLPDLKITVRKKLIEKQLTSIFELKETNNIIQIINLQTKVVTKISMLKKLKANIYCINNHPYPKFKIELL